MIVGKAMLIGALMGNMTTLDNPMNTLQNETITSKTAPSEQTQKITAPLSKHAQRVAQRQSLYLAAAFGNTQKVERLLQEGVDINRRLPQNDKVAPLLIACINCNIDTALLLLEKGARPNTRDNNGRFALMAAIDTKNSALVEALLQKGADPNMFYKDENPLIHAIKDDNPLNGTLYTGDNFEIIKLLLAYKADPNKQDPEGSSAFFYAVMSNRPPIIKEFFHAPLKPKPFLKNLQGFCPVSASSLLVGPHSEAYKLILEYIESVPPKTKTKR